MTIQTDILTEVTTFLERTGLSETKLGILAVKDGSFLPRLRQGRVTINSCNRLLEFMATYEPDNDTAAIAPSSQTGG